MTVLMLIQLLFFIYLVIYCKNKYCTVIKNDDCGDIIKPAKIKLGVFILGFIFAIIPFLGLIFSITMLIVIRGHDCIYVYDRWDNYKIKYRMNDAFNLFANSLMLYFVSEKVNFQSIQLAMVVTI